MAEKVILFQGDSITDFFRSYDNDNNDGSGFMNLIKAQLGFDNPGKYKFYNRAYGGSRIVDVYARIKKDIINLKPDYLTILVGGNDVWHELDWQNGVDAEKYEKIYCMLIEEVKAALPDVKIILMGSFVLPGPSTRYEDKPGWYETFRKEIQLRADAVERVAAKYGCVYIPLQEKFDALCELAEPEYWIYDGVHPSAMGHELIKREWLKAFETIAD